MTRRSPWERGDYAQVASRIAGIAEQTVDAVDHRYPLQGATVVDLACGTGSAALAAAARGAHVTGVDATPQLLVCAAYNAAAAGLHVRWVAADAADTGLIAQSADVVVSSMGLIFVEPGTQVGEIARLLRSGGVLGFSAWVPTADNPLFDPIAEVLGPVAQRTFSPEEWGETATATERLRSEFRDIDITTDMHVWAFESVPDAMRFLVEVSPIHVATIESAGDLRAPLLAAFEAAMTAHSRADGRVVVEAPYRVITARRR